MVLHKLVRALVSFLLLVDGDAAALVLLGLGHDDGQDSVAKGGADLVVVDPARELEGAGELADAALRDPELVLRLGLRLLLRGRLALLDLGDRGGGSGRSGGGGAGAVILDVILDRGLVRLVVVLLLLRGLVALLEEAGWRRAGRVGALDAAADDDGLRVRELEVDVLLLDARKLAVQLIVVLSLPQIELGSESLNVPSVVAPVWLRRSVVGVLVEVVNEAEEAGEVRLGLGVESGCEHRHFDWCVLDVVVIWKRDNGDC